MAPAASVLCKEIKNRLQQLDGTLVQKNVNLGHQHAFTKEEAATNEHCRPSLCTCSRCQEAGAMEQAQRAKALLHSTSCAFLTMPGGSGSTQRATSGAK